MALLRWSFIAKFHLFSCQPKSLEMPIYTGVSVWLEKQNNLFYYRKSQAKYRFTGFTVK